MDNNMCHYRTRHNFSPCSTQDNGTLLAVTGTSVGPPLRKSGEKAHGSDKGDCSSAVTEVPALAQEKKHDLFNFLLAFESTRLG